MNAGPILHPAGSAAGERPPWVVRIRRSLDQLPVGAGVLCDDRHVVTCAHVVTQAEPGEPPVEPVYVEFQFVERHEPIPAVVIDGGWHPERDDRTGDVAILELEGLPPEGAQPAPLKGTLAGVAQHEFHAYGYPRGHEEGGTSTVGDVIGRAGMENWLQLQAKSETGQALEKGFSGSPVWDITEPGVIGIVVSRERPRGDKKHPRTGFAIPVEVLSTYWNPIGALIREAIRGLDPEAERERLQELLDISLRPDGGLPRVADVDIYDIGVTKSKYVTSENPCPPYVPRRHVDQELDEALRSQRFILAVGDSTSGKSRTMMELLRRQVPDAQLIVPIGEPSAPRDLMRLRLPLAAGGAVLWLDDIDRFLRPRGLDLKLLDYFAGHEPPVKVVATITSKQHADVLTAEGEAGRVAKRVLARAFELRLPRMLQSEDQAEARRVYPQDDFAERGIGEQMVAAPLLEARYESAREARPEGWAVVQATADWGRIGIEAPIPESALRELFGRYHRAQYNREADDAAFWSGLDWARERVAGSIALLCQVQTDRGPAYEAFDYLRAYLDGQGRGDPVGIPGFAWEYATSSLGPAQLLSVAFAAMLRSEARAAKSALARARASEDDLQSAAWAALILGELMLAEDFDAARELLQEAVSSGVADVVPLAELDLANVVMSEGDLARARQLLESALESGNPQAAPLAQAVLGGVLGAMGELDRARALLESALGSEDPHVAPMAQANLGLLLADGGGSARKAAPGPGRVDRWLAQPALADSPDRRLAPGGSRLPKEFRESVIAQVVPVAQINLGRLLATQGEQERARELLESAMNSGNPQVVPQAQANMAVLLIGEGEAEWDRAQELLASALEAGNPFVTPFAQASLGGLLSLRGQPEQARRLLEDAAATPHAEQASRAADLLGDLLANHGDVEGARAAYQRSVDVGHPEWAPIAQIDLAILLANYGDPEQARRLLEAVVASLHAEHGPRAAHLLGDLLAVQGDPGAAEAAYRQAIDSNHPVWNLQARIDLGILLANNGDPVHARGLLESVAGSGHADLSPRAAEVLGELLAVHGDADAAKTAYQQAIDSDHPEWRPLAQIDLGILLAHEGDLTRAESLISAATKAPNLTTAASAQFNLGLLGLEREEPAAARQAFTRAEAVESPVRPWAQFQLAKLDAEAGDFAAATARLTGLQDVEGGGGPDLARVAQSYLEVVRLRQAGSKGRQAGDTEPLVRHGEDLFDAGEIAAAEEMLQAALELGDPAVLPRAHALLGQVRLAEGDLNGAQSQIEQALAAENPEVEPMARRYLGSVLARQGRREDARQVLLPLARSADRAHRPAALVLLGQLADLEQSIDEARGWFEEAVATGEEDAEFQARQGLANLPADPSSATKPQSERPSHDAPEADAPRQKRAQIGPPLSPLVLAMLGEVAMAEDEPSEARGWLAQAMASEDEAARSRAAGAMAVLLINEDQPEEARALLDSLPASEASAAEARQLLVETGVANAVSVPAETLRNRNDP